MAVIRTHSIIKRLLIIVSVTIILISGFVGCESRIGNWTRFSLCRNAMFSTWEHIDNAEAAGQVSSKLKEFASNADEKHIIRTNNTAPNQGGQLLLRAGIQFVFVISYPEYTELTIGLFQYRIYKNGKQGFRITELLLSIQEAEQTVDLLDLQRKI